jgi:signal transduction histidine kinase
MRNIARNSFKLAIYTTGALMLAATAVTLTLEIARPAGDRLPFLKFELDMFKVILAGFVVGMLGILIPAVSTEARQRLEQRKASRIAYSKAKTGVDYLKLRLAAASLAEAATALQTAHFHKHQAEQMYRKLFGARKVLEENAEVWDRLSPEVRIALLDCALPTKSELENQRSHGPHGRGLNK